MNKLFQFKNKFIFNLKAKLISPLTRIFLLNLIKSDNYEEDPKITGIALGSVDLPQYAFLPLHAHWAHVFSIMVVE